MNSADEGLTRIHELTLANEIDRACDLFESSWKQGNRPKLGEFLSGFDSSIRSAVFVELVKLDLYYRTAAGETPQLHDYSTQFPEFAEALSHFTEGAERNRTQEQTWRLPHAAEQIAHYNLREEVGQGAFGVVWTAWDNQLERMVAVKLPSDRFLGSKQVSLFLHEARAAAKLNHPNIVRVHDFGEENHRGYIVFELVSGINLKRWLKLRTPTPEQVASITASLADALAHAHQYGVVHRDLKPANVLIDDAGVPHITDFGLAKRMDIESTIAQDGEVMGTLPYMSPEQIGGTTRDVDAQADVYALGAILYQMLSGDLPFNGDRQQLMYQILNDEPQSLRSHRPSVPRDLETICHKAMAKDKSQRYATAADFRDDLQRFLRGDPIHARRTSAADRGWRWIRRNRLVAAAFGFGGCALFSLAGVIAYALTTPPLPEPGERMVTLTTIPEDASVAFIPLDELTGEPQPEKIIHCRERTPLHQSLPPGNYLVEAWLEDGSGRFHEVYRRVPMEEEQGLVGPAPHLRWTELSNGRIELPGITIPAAGIVNQDMALIEGTQSFLMGRDSEPMIPKHVRGIPSFYMDTTETTVSEHRAVASGGHLPADLKYVPVPGEDWAITLKWFQAVEFAELNGKRLPHEAEYEYAATWGGRWNYSWDGASPTDDREELFVVRQGFGPVGTPAFDCLPTQPPIFGLCTNVAEWSMTHQTAYYPGNEKWANRQFAEPADKGLRVVRGGDDSVAGGNPNVNREIRDPRRRLAYPQSAILPGIGYRCVRSTKPRLLPEDFVRVVED